MGDDVFIVGDGGHARSLFNVMKRLGKLPKAFLTINSRNNLQYEIPVINEDEFLNSAQNENVLLINGVGSTGNLDKRKWIYKSKKYSGLQFKSIIDPSAVLFDLVNIKNGAQIMAGVVLCNNVTVGENTIINTGVTIDHDCLIGRHCHCSRCYFVRWGNCRRRNTYRSWSYCNSKRYFG